MTTKTTTRTRCEVCFKGRTGKGRECHLYKPKNNGKEYMAVCVDCEVDWLDENEDTLYTHNDIKRMNGIRNEQRRSIERRRMEVAVKRQKPQCKTLREKGKWCQSCTIKIMRYAIHGEEF